MLARSGAHTGWLEIAWRNITPREAIWSRLGVRFMGLRPMAPTQSQRNWSEITRTMLGRLTPPPVWAAAEATAAAAGTALNHSRRFSFSAAIHASGGQSIIWRGRRCAAPQPDRIETSAPSEAETDRKSTRLNSSHANISYAVFCLKKNIK